MPVTNSGAESVGTKLSPSAHSPGFRFVDLSGYMFSGKAAVIDLLREFSGYYVPDYRHEFPLLRVQDGIMDLDKALLDDWSPIRSDAAIRRFRKLAQKMSNTRRKISLREEDLVAWGLSEQYGAAFSQLSMEYVDRLIDLRTSAPWPYAEASQSFYELLIQLLRPRMSGVRHAALRGVLSAGRVLSSIVFPKYAADFRDLQNSLLLPLKPAAVGEHDMAGVRSYSWNEVDLVIASGGGFLEATRDYLEAVLSNEVDRQAFHTIVMHNAFEPFNPWRPLRYFRDAKCIVVDRDPRDIFVTARTFSDGFNDNPNVYSRIAFAHDVSAFIRRHQILRSRTNFSMDPPKKVLRIRFEELVCHYDATVELVLDFLEVDRSAHRDKGKYFDPGKSAANVGLWKNCPFQEEIGLIRAQLASDCYGA